jgi:hypothetical protein
MEASTCRRCALALKISVIEPHPTRGRVDVATYRCPIPSPLAEPAIRRQAPEVRAVCMKVHVRIRVWRSVVVKQVEAADTDRDAAATMT